MRKKIAILFLFFSCWGGCMGQGYDAQWALGYNESVVDFRNNTVRIDSLPMLEYFIFTNASICDENGSLLYYTNGISICGVEDTLKNGTGLNPCAYTDADSFSGLNIPQAALFIPKPGSTRYYYLFHFSNDSLEDSRPGTLYYSVIDKEGNGGLGTVISKNNPILERTVLREGGMTACKHANGRDYWLVMGASDTNMFYKFLITPDSIFGPYTQNIGPSFPLPYDVGYSKFSQDGSKFVTGAYEGLVLIMDFDRCTGKFSNPISIINNAATNPDTVISGSTSVEFSPNNRFIYVADNINLNQYDLWSGDVQDSVQIFLADSIQTAHIRMIQLAPNGKIYGCDWNGGLPALHVVNYPDTKGDSAGFVLGGQPTYSITSWNLPNLINYKLGPLLGSGCDTITSMVDVGVRKQELRIIPNPADKYVYVEMGVQGEYEFRLLNEAGQLLDKKQTRQVDIFDTEHLAAGVYVLRVRDLGSDNVFVRRVVVEH